MLLASTAAAAAFVAEGIVVVAVDAAVVVACCGCCCCCCQFSVSPSIEIYGRSMTHWVVVVVAAVAVAAAVHDNSSLSYKRNLSNENDERATAKMKTTTRYQVDVNGSVVPFQSNTWRVSVCECVYFMCVYVCGVCKCVCLCMR